jgi:hypothetical protein
MPHFRSVPNPAFRVYFSPGVVLVVLPLLLVTLSWAAERPLQKTTTDKATKAGVSPLKAPFSRPFQYIGMSTANAARASGGTPNTGGNIVIDSAQAHMLLEATGGVITYVDVELKQTAPCSQTTAFDSEPVLGALSMNQSELELARKQTHFHTYYDHKRKLKVGVRCLDDGAPLSVGLSSKYYGK